MSNIEIDVSVLSDCFRALGNEHRLALFQRLSTCCMPGTRCCADEAARLSVGALGAELDIASSTLSHHLKELNRAGLVQMQRSGKNVMCWVEPEILQAMAAFFSAPLQTEQEKIDEPKRTTQSQ